MCRMEAGYGREFCISRAAGASAQLAVQSQAERYAAMHATLASRVTVGKSAIHGYGAFAKLPHHKGTRSQLCSTFSPLRLRSLTSTSPDSLHCGTGAFSSPQFCSEYHVAILPLLSHSASTYCCTSRQGLTTLLAVTTIALGLS